MVNSSKDYSYLPEFRSNYGIGSQHLHIYCATSSKCRLQRCAQRKDVFCLAPFFFFPRTGESYLVEADTRGALSILRNHRIGVKLASLVKNKSPNYLF